ncbi:hypothetical protein EAG08_02550 [Chryseobacterium sp. 3008163]|nr:hypothetical protein EAG08_02550 [Chryseobacterium sp. 3008163]
MVQFIFNYLNKKADNLGRLSADVLSQNFRGHNFSIKGKTFFESGLNLHSFFLCAKILILS